ncbi:major facilitator superfamily domain-containing protein [Aspergillus minisclerotigenes]|uniref:Major facilitator superfamily domain-containing protein n=1 Tax=Aspergillus minisclerotigenes TaxID=656917 RepID=A0A5N6IYJ1_9EURO|nr:major facilitator superfamily domain-containing protein [Aspergillus minisclerotigenes]
MSSDGSQLEKEESHSTATLRDSQNSDQQESEPRYPGPLKLTLIIISLNLAMFLVGLDNTIISSAIPKITDQFHALGDVGWYASAYLLTNCAFQLIWGKLFTFYVVKWVYLTALFIFELGSLICAVAPSSTALIVGRAIAGIGGGGVGNGSFLLIAHCVPPRQRPAFIGMMGSMYGIASIAGPLMGGAFTDNISWRWCFYINLPLGVLPAIIITFFIATFRGSKKGEVGFLNQLKQMDLPGTACLLPGVVCLLLALQWGGSTYPWKNGRIIALFVLSGLLFIAFIVIQYISGDRATVPGRVFSNRNVWGSALFGSCVTAGFFLLLYYIPIWLQAVKGASAIKSGIMNLPMLLGSVIFSLLGGTLTSIIGYYMPFAYLTVILMSIGSGLLSTLQVDSGHAQWIGYQFLVGAGVGSGLQTAFAAPQCVLPLEDIPIGTAVVIFTENLSAAVFVSVAQNVFSNQLRTNLATYVPEADASTVLSGGATDIKNLVPQELYEAVLLAYNKALDQTFYVGVALSCCAVLGVLGMQWVSVKKKDDTPSE